MRSMILRCPECLRFSLCDSCPSCGIPTIYTFPPKYSPEDRWSKYRLLERSETQASEE